MTLGKVGSLGQEESFRFDAGRDPPMCVNVCTRTLTVWNRENIHSHAYDNTHTHTYSPQVLECHHLKENVLKNWCTAIDSASDPWPAIIIFLLKLASMRLTYHFFMSLKHLHIISQLQHSSAQKKMKCIPVRSCIWHCTWKVCYIVLMQSWVPFHGEGLSHLQKIVWCGKLLFRSSGDFTEFLVWVLTSQILLTEFRET